MTTWPKWTALLLALVLTLGTLAGCADTPGQGSAPSTETTLEHTGTEPSIPPETQLAGMETQLSKQGWMETVPEYTGTMLIEPDPDREYYLSLANQDCDFYPGGMFGGTSFYIISKRLYNITEVGVSIDMQNPYRVEVRSRTDDCHQKMMDSGGDFFCNYHYLAMQGVDWRELGQMAMDDANIDLELAQYSVIDEEYRELQERKKFYNTMEVYQRQFEAIPLEEIPSFYVYDVSISFEGMYPDKGKKAEFYDETVEELEVRLGDQRIPVRFGQWRFHSQNPEELTSASSGVQMRTSAKFGFWENPYHNGFHRVLGALDFTAQKNMTITSVRSFGADIPMVGALVQMGTAGEDGSLDYSGATDFYWDLKMPLDIPAGQTVWADLYLRDARFAQYEVCCILYVVVEYELEGRANTMVIPLKLSRDNLIWDTYLMAFEGIDLGEYYTCFYNPQYDDYVWRMPEEWKK